MQPSMAGGRGLRYVTGYFGGNPTRDEDSTAPDRRSASAQPAAQGHPHPRTGDPNVLLFLTSLLEYHCFTVVCQFLLYHKVNQLYIYIYPHTPSLLRLPPYPPPYPTPLGGHKAPS